jgi:hypothetical protein
VAAKDVLLQAMRERAEVLADALREEDFIIGPHLKTKSIGHVSFDVFAPHKNYAPNTGPWVATVFVYENGTIAVEDPPSWMAYLSTHPRSVRAAIKAKGLGEWLR